MTARESPTAGSFGEVQQIGQEDEPSTCDCVAEGFDNILPATTADRVLPQVALDMFPELRGTVWRRIGWRTVCSVMAHVLLGTADDERIQALAYRLAQAVTASGAVTVLDHKTLLLDKGRAVAFGDRSLYLLRCNDGG